MSWANQAGFAQSVLKNADKKPLLYWQKSGGWKQAAGRINTFEQCSWTGEGTPPVLMQRNNVNRELFQGYIGEINAVSKLVLFSTVYII